MRHLLKYSMLFTLPLSTMLGSPYTPTQRCPGDFSVEAEWIYFSPNSESKYFAIDNGFGVATSITGERKAVEFDTFHSGYRVAAAFTFCDNECDRYASVTWTSLKAHETRHLSDTAVGRSIVPTDLPPSVIAPDEAGFPFASGSHHFSYYALDGVVGQKILCDCCMDIDLFVGLHYAHFITKEHDVFLTGAGISSAILREQNNFWGIGPELGINAVAPIWCGFSLVGNISSAFIAGRPSSSLDVAGAVATRYDLHNDRKWRLVPYLDLRLGLNYDFCLPCNFDCLCSCFPSGFRGSIAAGYEALTYFNALGSIVSLNNDTPSATIDDYRNVTMHGPFVAVALSF